MKSERIDVRAIKDKLEEVTLDIENDIRAGNTTYLPIANAKELSAYADPGSEQSIRGVIAWNAIYPDDQIDLPSKVKMLKLNLFDEEDIEPLREKYPDVYSAIKETVFDDDSGIFVVRSVDKKGKEKIKSKGLQVIAIPSYSNIPEWCIPYIDYNSVVGTILGPFKSVTDLLGLQTVETGYSKNGVNRKTERLTNFIEF